MKIYEVNALAKPTDQRFTDYASVVGDDKAWDFLFSAGEPFSGVPFGKKWKIPQFYIEEPLLPRPDFFWLDPAAFACNEKARLHSGEPLEISGEFLPVRVEGEKGKFWIYNVTKTLNVLDPKQSLWERIGPGKADRILRKPSFIASRFGEEVIFKIPENRGACIYCVEYTGDPEDGEFKALVEKHNLTGLRFDLVWSDEKRARRTARRSNKPKDHG
jgi:hypothetical protein